MFYRINWQAATRRVFVETGANSAPAPISGSGMINLGTFLHNNETEQSTGLNGMQGLADNHVIYHQVQDMLYKQGVQDMQSIKIYIGNDPLNNVDTIQPSIITLSSASRTVQANAALPLGLATLSADGTPPLTWAVIEGGDYAEIETGGADPVLVLTDMPAIGEQPIRVRASNDSGSAEAVFTLTASGEQPPLQYAATALWVGAVTTDTQLLSVYTEAGASTVQAFADPVGGGARILGPVENVSTIEAVNPATLYPSSDYGVARCEITGLSPDTEYTYGVRIDGATDPSMTGTGRTRPDVRREFTFGFGTCFEMNTVRTYNNFDTMAAQPLEFFAVLDDRGYSDITVNDFRRYYRADWGYLHHPKIGPFHRAFPVYNVPGDHDFGADNSNANSAGKPGFMQWWRNHAPQPVTATGALDPVDFAVWIAPGLKLVMADTRTNRSGVMFMDPAQEARFIAHIQEVGAIPDAAMIWNSGTPWISSSDNDTWHGAQAQRQRIADAVLQYAPGRVAIICGDAHMLAFDDGTNSPGGMPVFHAAPMARANSTKGGPYSGGTGTFTQTQYGQITATPVTGGWQLAYRGYSCDAQTGAQTLRLSHTTTLVAPVNTAPAIIDSPAISGSSAVGGTLSAQNGAASGYPTPTASRIWTRNGASVGTGTTLNTAGWDEGDEIGLAVTWSNGVSPDATASAAPVFLTANTGPVLTPEQAYIAAVMPHDPQFLLTHREGNQFVDVSGNGRHGAVVGAEGSHITAGPHGLPFFAGTRTSHIEVAHDAAFDGGDFTVLYWHNANNDSLIHMGRYHRGPNERIATLDLDITSVDVRANGTGTQPHIVDEYPATGWYFQAFSYDATANEFSVYIGIDGVLRKIAQRPGGTGYTTTDSVIFNGRKQEASVDRRGNTGHAGMARLPVALTEAQVQEIYASVIGN